MEEGHDFLIVYDGRTKDSPLLSSLTGDLNLDPIISTGNNIFITFESDEFGNRKGFNISINTMKMDPICQLALDYFNWKLKSPNVNKEGLTCNWVITADIGFYIKLKMTKFNVRFY